MIYDFFIIAGGIDAETEDFGNLFFNAGCDDVVITARRGVIILDFGREAKSFAAAISSGIADVLKVGATVVRVEPDDLVSMSDVAKRTGLTRAAVSLYGAGERARGFPSPIARISSDAPLYGWCSVADWLRSRDRIDAELARQAFVVSKANELIASPDFASTFAQRLGYAEHHWIDPLVPSGPLSISNTIANLASTKTA